MSLTDQLLFASIIPCLLLSALLSGAELILALAGGRELKGRLAASANSRRYLEKLLSEPGRTETAIRIIKISAYMFASAAGTVFTVKAAAYYGINIIAALLLEIFFLALCIIMLGEIIPRVISARNLLLTAKLVIWPVYWLNVIIFPLTELLTELSRSLSSKAPEKYFLSSAADSGLSQLPSTGRQSASIYDDENELIRSVVESKTTVVREIMTHRTEITAVPDDISLTELITVVQNSSHSRIPVYRENLDDITGILHAKDLLRQLQNNNPQSDFSLDKIIRSPLIVPETKLINDLMQEFQEKKMHVAIVVDEYGGTAGLVTLEDIIEEVVGELRDELSDDNSQVKKVSDTTFIVDASISVDEFIEEFNMPVNDEDRDYDTVAGWIYHQTGEIPKNGYTFHYGNFKIIVTDAGNNRIRRILVEKKQ